jgi:hypothetical protein
MGVIATTIEALGWDAGWAETFAPFAARGHRPARVIAVHRDTAVIRDGDGDRSAGVSGAFRFEALAASDFPAVGDWVALDSDVLVFATPAASPVSLSVISPTMAPAAAPRAAPRTLSPLGPDLAGSAAGAAAAAGGGVVGVEASTTGSTPVVCLAHCAHSPWSFCCCSGLWFFAG